MTVLRQPANAISAIQITDSLTITDTDSVISGSAQDTDQITATAQSDSITITQPPTTSLRITE